MIMIFNLCSSTDNNYSPFKSTLKRQKVPSESEKKPTSPDTLKLPQDPLVPPEKTQNESGSDSPGIHGDDDTTPGAVSGVRHLFRELSTPSSAGSDVGESGTEDNKDNKILPKPKLKLNNLNIDFSKLKSKLQLSPPKKMEMNLEPEEPMEIGTESDSPASCSRASTPNDQSVVSLNVPSPSTEGASDKANADATAEPECQTSDVDVKTTTDEDGMLESRMAEKNSTKSCLDDPSKGEF